MKNIYIRLGEKIKSSRKLSGLSQEQLGEMAGVSYKFIGEIERGKANPTIDILSRISDAIKTPLKEFFDFSEGDSKQERRITYSEEGKEFYIREELKKLIPPKDVKKQKEVLKALKILKETFKK